MLESGQQNMDPIRVVYEAVLGAFSTEVSVANYDLREVFDLLADSGNVLNDTDTVLLLFKGSPFTNISPALQAVIDQHFQLVTDARNEMLQAHEDIAVISRSLEQMQGQRDLMIADQLRAAVSQAQQSNNELFVATRVLEALMNQATNHPLQHGDATLIDLQNAVAAAKEEALNIMRGIQGNDDLLAADALQATQESMEQARQQLWRQEAAQAAIAKILAPFHQVAQTD
jgi:hypothetical protein